MTMMIRDDIDNHLLSKNKQCVVHLNIFIYLFISYLYTLPIIKL
ncbi:uncharacterized protein METZ01_LOCUS127114 [marine metagenome]|uniref:Uncharacterized protein n=1 Tax=marine metagenome TaxID=408172 RepID=A0A381YBI9_9ZZZZ